MPQKVCNGSFPKSWLRCQESQGTFRLRYQLAEDGCSESQIVIAKGLLSETTNSKEEFFTNAELAVYWLVQAAKQGHDEACLLLKQCCNTGVGITLRNRFLVESCLRLSEAEKISLRVGHKIYRAVMGDSENPITEEVFQEKVQVILSQDKMDLSDTEEQGDLIQSMHPMPDETFSSIADNGRRVFVTEQPPKKEITEHETVRVKATEKSAESKQNISMGGVQKGEGAVRKEVRFISPGDVVSSVQQCLEGNVPLITLKRVINNEEYSKWISTKYFFWMKSSLGESMEMLIEDLSSATVPYSLLVLSLFLCGIFFLAFPMEQWYLLVHKYRILVMSLLCLSTMVSCSCYVILNSFGCQSSGRWFDLIHMFEPKVKTPDITQRIQSKNKLPLFIFFLTSVPYVSLYAMNLEKYTNSDMCLMCFFLMVLVDRTITWNRRYVTISFVLNMLLCAFKTNVVGTTSNGGLNFLNFGVWFSFGESYSLHLNCFSCLVFLLMLPYLYVRMSLGNQKRGWHLVLLPHLMSVTWMNLAFIHFAGSQTSDLLWGICFWCIVLFIGKYVGTTVSLITCLSIKYLYLNGVWSSASIVLFLLLLCTAYFVSCSLLKALKSSGKLERYVLLMCGILALVAFNSTTPPANLSDLPPALSWDTYQTSCHRPAWYQTNTAEVEIACLPLKGKSIKFEGTLISVDVIQVENHLQKMALALPSPFHDWFLSAFGEPYLDCDQLDLAPFKKRRCSLYQSASLQGCHLHNWDVYKFKLTIEVSSRTAPEVAVIASHDCLSFIKSLKEGDSLNISGELYDKIGSSSPVVILHKATCNSCYDSVSCVPQSVTSVLNYDSSLRCITTFYLYPLIQHG